MMSAIGRVTTLFRTTTMMSMRPLATTSSTANKNGVHQSGVAGSPPKNEERGLGTVRDVLKVKGEKYYHTQQDVPVIEAARQMVKHNIGSLIILQKDSKVPVGIVTETDYLQKVIVPKLSLEDTLVKDIMSTKKFTYVNPSATLHQCMELMTERRIRHIPVVDEFTQNILGMVSVRDIVSELVGIHKRNAEHLHSFISGSY